MTATLTNDLPTALTVTGRPVLPCVNCSGDRRRERPNGKRPTRSNVLHMLVGSDGTRFPRPTRRPPKRRTVKE